MNFLDLFSGLGGFRLGMELNGHECVGHCEIDKYADKSYREIHNVKENEWYANDITTVTDELIRDELGHRNIDVICGGFPCQAFSIAGKRRGFEDTRGTLFFDVCRFAKILRPKYLFLENVRGLLSHDNGDTFEAILCALADIGYDAEWEVLNTKRWLPQNRERVFIIGHLRGASTRKIFPLPEQGEMVDGIGRLVTNSITTRIGGAESVGTYIVESKQLPEVMQIGNIHQSVRERENPHTGRIYSPEGISPCLSTMQGGQREPKIAVPVLTPDRLKKRQNGRRFKEDGEEMFTLTAQDKHGVMVSQMKSDLCDHLLENDLVKPFDVIRHSYINSRKDGDRAICESNNISPTLDTRADCFGVVDGEMRIRKLTPLECFRLQGYPDEMFYKAQAVNSDSQLYKQAGNSVSVPVIAAIAERFETGELI